MDFLKNIVRFLRQKILQLKLSLFAKKLIISKKRTLIIAPHPDDETFGCAGLIMQKLKNGSDVYVVFLTNGEKSLLTVPEAELKQKRRESAIKASEFLGVSKNNIYWMDLPDGNIPRIGTSEFQNKRDSLLKIIYELEISEVHVTHYLDGWSDHIAAYELTIAALKKSNKDVDLYLYWVWTWYYLGIKKILSLSLNKLFLLPIQPLFEKKKEALDIYYNAKTASGEQYMGYLPIMFLKAFDWPYEVYEKVDYR